MDYAKIQNGLILRSRSEGDFIRLAGRGVGKSLKKLMNEQHIPAYLRDGFPLLCDEKGVVLVPGVGCDERVAPGGDTKDFLVWMAQNEPCYTVDILWNEP